MAHVHLEDGAFTLLWVAAWSASAALVILLAMYRLREDRMPTTKLAIASMCVAVGFAAFQLEIPVLGGGVHLNLTPLMGILVGPSLGSLCVLMINIFSAAIGHGGWGMIGANTLVNVSEVVIGYYVYRLLRGRLGIRRFTSGFGAAATALTISAFIAVAIVSISDIQGSTQTGTETLRNMLIITVANVLTGLFEGVVTGYIVSFLGRLRPDLLGESQTKGIDDEERFTAEVAPDG